MNRGPTSLLLLTLLLTLPVPVALSAPADSVSSARALQDRYDLAGVSAGGRNWSSSELQQLASSLASLDGKERKAIRGVQFVRGTAPRQPRESGLFEWDRQGRRITIYDGAFREQGAGPNWTVVHEVGHAIAAWPLVQAQKRERRALAKYNDAIATYNAQVGAYNKAAQRFNRTQKESDRRAADAARAKLDKAQTSASGLRGPALSAKRRTRKAQRALKTRRPRSGVLADYRSVLGRGPAPTRYGSTHIRESFAEAMAMYRCDPARLKKQLPRVHEWFTRGGHLTEL